MTLSDILTLGTMGYTKADIDALMEREKSAEETKPETSTKPAAPAKDAHKPAAPTQDNTKTKAEPAASMGNDYDRIMARLDALTAQMQEHYRTAAEMGANIIDPRTAGISSIAALSGYELKKGE